MLIELRVENLGVIEHAQIAFDSGMTALTGETGAGKTMLVEAIELLLGGRADPAVVRRGADEAVIDGRFVVDGREVVLTRAVPASGRSRAYVDGRPVTARQLAATGAALVELHGQHDHQALRTTAAQRDALDRFAGTDLGPRRAAREALAAIDAELDALGGDERTRQRELDLLRYQLEEIDGVGITGPDEDDTLRRTEEDLASAVDRIDALAEALDLLGDGGAVDDGIRRAHASVSGAGGYEGLGERLAAVVAELDELRADLRVGLDTVEVDPERLDRVRERRRHLADLRRKYGEDLAEVLAFREATAQRLGELESHGEHRARLETDRVERIRELTEAEAAVGAVRREAAPRLAAAIARRLTALAMPDATVEIVVPGDGAGDEVEFRLRANPGADPAPLARAASGGELARAMLALRLVLTDAPATMVFDEVDAGIGGSAAVAVGAALAQVAESAQVLVVTHLAQVAAAASAQAVVTKHRQGDRTTTTVVPVTGEAREVELARMLSGTPGSETAREHARELLER